MNRMAQLLAFVSLATLVSACEDGPILPPASTSGGGTAGADAGGGGAGGGAGGGPGYTFSVTKGFNGAESCLWDSASQHWYVSNLAPMSMDLTAPDGEGWISRLDKDGAIVDEKWVSGFDSPAGLRISKGVLYVNDITKVHAVTVSSGAEAETYTFPEAALLNDPAIDEATGMGYAADTFGDAIYQFKIGQAASEATFVASADLKGPNGLLIDGDKLYVASLVDFDPANLGPFLMVDLGTQAITQVGTTLGKFDGLEKWKDGYLLSDNQAGKLVLFHADGSSEVLIDLMTEQGYAPAADIGVDPERGIICVPNLGDSVAFVQVQ